MNVEVRKLLRSIDHIEGVEIKENRSGHISVYHEGVFVTSVAGTPSDYRWRANTVADLRRAGITPAVRARSNGPRDYSLRSVDEIRDRVTRLKSRASFARFLVNDVPVLAPKMRTYKTTRSAEASLFALVKGGGTHGWAHELLDFGLRQWDRLPEGATKIEPEPEPVWRDDASETITLRLELGVLKTFLGRFGIELEVER